MFLLLAASLLLTPRGIAVDAVGNIFVADHDMNVIRRIDTSGIIRTFAGSPGQVGSVDGVGLDARFNAPAGIAVDPTGVVYVADSGNHTIRKISPVGIVTTFAGTAGMKGSTDGKGSTARFDVPLGVAIDRIGNIIVADSANRTIRHITPEGVVSTYAGVAGRRGTKDGALHEALFESPSAVAIDKTGNVFIADTFANSVRKISRAGDVTTVAGKTAKLNNPAGVATDREGNVYVTDWVNATIRKIGTDGKISTLAGVPSLPKTRDGGKCCLVDGMPHIARFAGPYGIVVDRDGNIFVADTFNASIREITPQGMVSTVQFHD